MENKQDIGKAFRDKLDGYYKEPGDAVWQGINASLQQKKRGGFRIPLWGRATAIVLAVIMLAVFTHPMWEDYMPRIIIKMPNEKSGDANGVTGTGTNAGGAQPSGTTTTPTATIEQPESTNSTTTAGTPRSQDAATVSSGAANANAAVQQNNTASKNKASAKGSNALGKAASSTSNSAVAVSGKNNKTGAANTATAAASDKGQGNKARAGRQQAKATGKAATQNSTAVASNKENGNTNTPTAKRTSATTNSTATNATAVTASAKAGNNNFAGTTKTGVPESNTAIAAADKATAKSTSAASATNATLPQNAATTAAGTAKTAGANTKNSKDTNILYSSGNFPTITKAIADSLVLAQKAIDYKESKERTYARPAYAASDSLTGGDGYSKGFYAFAYVAPSNYKFGESTSVIDPSLNNHASSAETSTNFGAYIGYEFSSQFSVRAGVSSTKMVQNTGNVTLGGNYSGVDYANGMNNTTANVALGGGPVTLRQKTTFIEVPVEATYAMFGTRADLYFKGGFSTLFLQDNELHAQNSQGSVLLGSLNTAKDFSLSGNLGIGFYYKFTRELQLNVEPGVKYYFNAFDNVSPWSLSVQAGLLYRF